MTTNLHFKSIEAFHQYFDLEQPENPLFSVLHTENQVTDSESCDAENTVETIRIVSDFYAISFKKIISGELLYGRTKYDCTNGTLLFTAPKQELVFKDIVVSSESYHIAFHKDYIRNHEIYHKIKKYNFFHYHVNEALHLSPKEEQLMKNIFHNIKTEYENNQDEFSKELILSQLDTLLKYADRFYKRQFMHREDINKELLARFNSILYQLLEKDHFSEKGIPTIEWMASTLKVSQRFMSDTIKAHTGKTAVEQITLFLIEEAKSLLLNPRMSISETAYKLGFVYPQYFTRVFKKKVGMSPRAYIKNYSLN